MDSLPTRQTIMSKTDITKEAYEESVVLLEKLVTKKGFTASNNDISNYKRVWSRDGIIAGLAALRTGRKELVATFAQTLNTLRKHQDHTGRIPSNVSLDEKHVSYGTTVGRIDATIWYVLGACQYMLYTKDDLFCKRMMPSIKKALQYLDCLELNGRGLMYIPHGGDWADEYINHGYVLFDQVLRYIALKNFHRVTRDEEVGAKVAYLKNLIVVNYLPDANETQTKYIYHKLNFDWSLQDYDPPFPIPYFTNHSVKYHVDNFASALLLHSHILDAGDHRALQDGVLDRFLKEGTVIPAFDPPIRRGNREWEHLKRSHLFHFKNKPGEYHNGGLWPLVHGFFISTLVNSHKKEAAKLLKSFARQLKKDGYTFPEYYNAKTMKPGGTPNLGFTAAGYIFAYNAIKRKRPPIIR